MELAAAERDRMRISAEEMIGLPEAVRSFGEFGRTCSAHRDCRRNGGA